LNLIKQFEVSVESALPAEGRENCLYLVPSDENSTEFNEFIWLGDPENRYEQIGTTSIEDFNPEDLETQLITITKNNESGEIEKQLRFDNGYIGLHTNFNDLGQATSVKEATWKQLIDSASRKIEVVKEIPSDTSGYKDGDIIILI
jgi:hypothetical protein